MSSVTPELQAQREAGYQECLAILIDLIETIEKEGGPKNVEALLTVVFEGGSRQEATTLDKLIYGAALVGIFAAMNARGKKID